MTFVAMIDDRSRTVMGGVEVIAWLTSMRQRGLAAGTIEKRASVCRRISAFTHTPVIDLTREQIIGWLDSRPNQARTRYADISHLAAFFQWAIREELVDVDPTTRIDRPKVRAGLPRPVGTRDLHHVIDQAPTVELRAMLLLASYGGLRCGEIAQLRGGDFHDGMMLLHGKGGRQRVVPIHPDVAAAVQQLRRPAGAFLFELDAGQVSRTIRCHMHACGVTASAHQLRHWFATAVYETSGHDLRMVQELLGHSSPTTTAIYTRWSRGSAGPAIDALGA